MLQFADAEEDCPSNGNIEIKFSDRLMTSSFGSDVSDDDEADDDYFEAVDLKAVKNSGNIKSVKLVLEVIFLRRFGSFRSYIAEEVIYV